MSANAHLSSDGMRVDCLLERFERARVANTSNDPGVEPNCWRKAVGGPNNHNTYDTTSDDGTTRTGLESIVFAKQEQFTLSS